MKIKDCLPAELYLRLKYYRVFHKKLNLRHPVTFNEKLQWLKLYDHNPIYPSLVDKYEVKKIVSEKIGSQYIIPTYGVWNSFDEIDFDKLPNRFVLKCTHDSGGVFIVKDKKSMDIKAARSKINNSLKNNFYYEGREWPYKSVKPRIIAEKYLSDSVESEELSDYKLQCFDGKVDDILVCSGRNSEEGVKYYYFDKDWNYLPYSYETEDIEKFKQLKPQNLELMIQLAEKLSRNFPELRVDLYEIQGKVYFGELTLFSNSGFDTTITPEADKILGEKLSLKM